MASDDFNEIKLRPVTGIFDTQSDPDQTGFGNFTLVKNLSIRGTRKRCRRGGWERLFAEVEEYNNQDLHDQLFEQQIYGEQITTTYYEGGEFISLSYPYTWPDQSNGSYSYTQLANDATCGYYPQFGLSGSSNPEVCFTNRWLLGFPYNYIKPFYGACNNGAPNFYAYSYYYFDCPGNWPALDAPSYPYGPAGGIYDAYRSFTDVYCQQIGYPRPGCAEAITHLAEVSAEGAGRKLIAATMSRIYALNETSGNWKLLADGLGNSTYSDAQCGCNDVRFTSATMGAYILLTNGFNSPLLWYVGDDSTLTCTAPAQPVGDLEVLGISAAGVVVSWKGFMMLLDVLENGSRHGGKIIWSDFEDPTAWISSDVSMAGQATVAVGEKFLAAEPLGNFLYLYTDRSIWRVTLLDSDVLFSFDRVYSGSSALKYRYSMVNTGKEHIFLGQTHIYMMTLFDTRPIEVDWLNKASPVIFSGMNEDDAAFSSINELNCDQVVGGWNEEFKEVWFSWPTGNNDCPNMSLVLNMQYNAADLVDHGFTAFKSYRPDPRISIDGFLLQQGICSTQELIDDYFREGLPCGAVKSTSVPLTPGLNYTNFPNWDVIVGAVDLIGKNSAGVELFDLLPGNGLYVDLAGSGGMGTIRTKSTFNFTNGHTFKITCYVAGNQRVAASDQFTVTAGALLSSNLSVLSYTQLPKQYHPVLTFVGNGSSGKLSIGFTFSSQAATTSSGPLLMSFYLEDITAGTILFFDDFESTAVTAPSSLALGATRSILNATEDLSLPADIDSLCARLAGMTEDDFCRDCGIQTKFVMASASDFTLKQYSDDVFYREYFVPGYLSGYCAYACDGGYYGCVGYDSVLQSGAQDFSSDNEKVIKRIVVEADALDQTTPSDLNCYVGYSSQAACERWILLEPQELRCLSDFTAQQLIDQGIRPDRRLNFPTFYRGRYLHYRLRISGIGGGCCLSEVVQVVKGAERNTSR